MSDQIEIQPRPCKWGGMFDAPLPLGSVVRFAENVAAFSDDKSQMCRYIWGRCWDESLPLWLWVAFNPSKATQRQCDDDQTVKRCVGFTKQLSGQEAGGLVLVNLFAYRTKNPDEIDPNSDCHVGAENDKWIRLVLGSGRISKIIAAWGNDGHFTGRRRDVVRLLRESGIGVFQLGESTKNNAPWHPSRQRGYNISLRLYDESGEFRQGE